MTRYSPGEWFAIVSYGGVALLPPTVPAATAEQVWTALRAGEGLGAVIEGLVGAFGTSLSLLPDFAVLVGTGADTRVAVRGRAVARLLAAGAAEPVEITGAGVTTWSEHALAQVTSAVLIAPGAPEGGSLPLADGIVLAGRIEVVASDAPVAAPEPLPAAVPEPAPVSVPESSPGAVSVPSPAAVPEPSLVSVPEPFPLATPEPSPVVAPEPSPVVIPEPSSTTTPESSSTTTPEPSSATTPEPSSTTIPEPVEGSGDVPLTPAVPDAAAEPPQAGGEPVAAAETTWVGPPDDAARDYAALLFGETVMSSVEAAAVREPEAELTAIPPVAPPVAPGGPTPVPPPTPAPDAPPMIQSVPFGSPPPQSAGDHDGQTLLVSDLRALIASGNSQPSTPPERTSPVLLLPGQGRVVLDRNAVVGTRPQLSRVQGSNLPHLVTVPSPSGEISRNHLELRVEGSNVLVVDLNSTNGTVLLRAGSEPVRLHPGEPSMLVAGDRLDLGDGMVLGFEGLA